MKGGTPISFYVAVVIPGISGTISTVWAMTGGIIDMRRLFIDLDKHKIDVDDNGQCQKISS